MTRNGKFSGEFSDCQQKLFSPDDTFYIKALGYKSLFLIGVSLIIQEDRNQLIAEKETTLDIIVLKLKVKRHLWLLIP